MTRPLVVALVIRAAIMNIPTKVRAKAWERCFRLLAQHGGIFGINEAGSPRAKRLYRRLADELGYGHFGLDLGPNPVFWDRDEYRFVSGRQIKLHGRGRGKLARRWPGFNGARFLTIVTLRHRKTGQLVTVLNWHLVAPGWKVRARWRARMRALSEEIINGQVAFHRDRGRVVLGIGDGNQDGWHVPNARWLHREGPDLMLLALPTGVHLEQADTDVFPAPTDHKDGKSADIGLIGAAA